MKEKVEHGVRYIKRKHIPSDGRAKYLKFLLVGEQLINKVEKVMKKFRQEYFLPINKFDDFLQCLKFLTADSKGYQ